MGQILKAYSAFVVKSIDDKRRTFKGWATTPAVDRVGDTIDPLGATFKNPLTLLHQHKHDKPIGKAVFGKPSKKGIEFEAEIPVVEEEGDFRNRVDTAWAEIKYGVVSAVSIGFRPLKYAFKDEGGVDFQEIEIFELSTVSVPALPQAVITSVKSMNCDRLSADTISLIKKSINDTVPASDGTKGLSIIKTVGVSTQNKTKTGRTKMAKKTTADKIADFKETRTAKQLEIKSLMDESDEGMTFDAEQKETFDNLEAEIKEIDGHIKRLERVLALEAQTAESVDETVEGRKAIQTIKTFVPVQVKNTPKLDAGIAFARAAKCLALGHLEHRNAVDIAKSIYGDHAGIVAATHRLLTKTAVAAADTSTAAWAGNLVGEETNVYADFVEYLRPQTILGRFGTNGVPSLRRVPFRTPLIGQTSGGDGYWVGEGAPKPLTKFDFSRTTLEPLKVANIAVATMETIRDSSPSADIIIRDQLAAALRERLDMDFIDPDKSAVSGVSPASILNGVSGIGSSGADADGVRVDMKALFSAFISANNAPTSGVWVMSATTALALSLMMNPLGQPEFPGLTMNGGMFAGLPVVVSEYVPTDSSGSIVALINASDIYLGDEGGIDLAMSTEASLQMDNAPDDPATASTIMVSLFQRNLVAFRAERTINWARRRSSAVAYLTAVNWGAGS